MTALARSLLALILLGLTLAAPARADEAADKAAFQQLYAGLHAANISRDKAKMKALLTADFQSIDLKDARMTADQMIDLILASPKPTPAAEQGPGTEVLSVTIAGEQAEVKQRYHLTGSRKSSDGVAHAMDMMARSRDIWVLKDGQWLLKETRTDEMELKADGLRVFYKIRENF